jgi:hypothetical protein
MKEIIYLYIRRKAFIIGFLLLIFGIVSPYFFTRSFLGVSFGETGQIGDTIGGLTAPFLNLLGSFLLYLALMEQAAANNLTKKEQKDRVIDENNRLKNIQEMIIWDLETNIEPKTIELKQQIEDFIPTIKDIYESRRFDKHTFSFNTELYKAINKNDLFKIFNKKNNDLKIIIEIYTAIEYLKINAPFESYSKMLSEIIAGISKEASCEIKEVHKNNVLWTYENTLFSLLDTISELQKYLSYIIINYK